MGRRFEELTEEEKGLLKACAWPGTFASCKTLLNARSSCPPVTNSNSLAHGPRPMAVNGPGTCRLPQFKPAKILSAADLEQFEKDLKKATCFALETCGWKISGAKGVSVLLGLPPSTVSSRIKALGIRRL